MRYGWMWVAVVGAAIGCSETPEAGRTDVIYTTGGDGKPVGPSRVARPLEPAGPRANYPEPQDAFGVERTPADPMMANAPAEAGTCPAVFSGVRIDVTDVYDGAAIMVTGDRVLAAAIQASARAMATEQQESETAIAEAPEPTGTEPAEEMGKPGEIAMPPVRTEVVDLAEGARISYFAEDPDDVIEVRNAVRRLASAMESGSCPPL